MLAVLFLLHDYIHQVYNYHGNVLDLPGGGGDDGGDGGGEDGGDTQPVKKIFFDRATISLSLYKGLLYSL